MWALTVLRESSQQATIEIFSAFEFSIFSWKVDFIFLLQLLLFVKCKSFGWRESWKVNLANPKNLKLAVGRDGKTSGELPSRCEHYIHSNLASQWQVEWSVLGSFEKGGPRDIGQTTKATNPIRHLPLTLSSDAAGGPKTGDWYFIQQQIFLWNTDMYFLQCFVNVYLLDCLSSLPVLFKLPNWWTMFWI